ncbi:flavin-containing monooxygenase [Nocardia halotolerans]|uniref:Flavin-containing monooxygenase n=1 Tax=Nocardia halotolerans TaxID=1755878 RepID=A0ABV8VM08_9NOCA
MATKLIRAPKIIIIGAGVAGIAAAVTFKKAGFDDFVILEKGADVGGVWFWNRYPGLTCDVPSQLYQFGFAPKPDWSRVWATGPEIQRYHAEVVDKFGLREHVRLNSEVTDAVFDGRGWVVTVADGTELTADFVIAATGVLHHPFTPDLPGLDSFEGSVVHTARWDDSIGTAGKRIAVVGSGSTGVQVVSALQPDAVKLTQFARTPQWVLWAPMGAGQSPVLAKLLAASPELHGRVYAVSLWASGILADVALRPTWRRRALQRLAKLSLRAQVRNKSLREALTPDYQPLCKRQVISGTYYQAIQADNAELVTDKITEVTPTGIRTADGRDHDIDVIVFATGFHPHNYMRPMNLRGRDGLTIDEAWAKGPRAYRMTAIPGFPNLFTVLGPNSPTGSISLQYSAELTARYITQWLHRYAAGEVDTVEVTEQATARFNDAVAEAMGPTVWNTGCNSWYFTDQNTIDLWPFDRKTTTAMLTEPDDRDFLIGSPARCGAVAESTTV